MVKYYVFTDFDGTLSLTDTGAKLIDICFGYEKRKALDKLVLNKVRTYTDCVAEMWDSVNLTWDQAKEAIKDAKIDPYFKEFQKQCNKRNIPIAILSSGLIKLIHEVLNKSLTDEELEKIQIFANDHTIGPNGHWKIIYRDNSELGHDKGKTIDKIKNNDKDLKIIFIGDGMSDISASQHADYLFAKEGRSLQRWCEQEKIPYYPYTTFEDVWKVLETIV
ncbi:phosphoric monoester hydrolase [Anaeromyces robustus]|uniref:Phosphoric monoester hydrolase n=1 Tax=Anaeromyces robustus TaxID=1754192 RepID=A0A1Y1XFS2_9FUNG|nr:phosphoric monoester hydrolase [Anaeromyces robustus]|eukprot:ORX84598.1 phosphoric monoester hydrolase [Anaeromyces robustus]